MWVTLDLPPQSLQRYYFFFTKTVMTKLGSEATAQQIPWAGWDGSFGLPGWYRGGSGGVAGGCARERLFFHPVPLCRCDLSGGTTGSAPEKLTLCLAIREGRERYQYLFLLLSSHTAAPVTSLPSCHLLILSSKLRDPQSYWHDYKPHTLQYTPVRLQNSFLCRLLFVNFLYMSLEWLFTFPIVIPLYFSFLSFFFPPSLLLCSKTSVQF